MKIILGTRVVITNRDFTVHRAPARVATRGLGAGEIVTIRSKVQGGYADFASNTITGNDDSITLKAPGDFSISCTTTVADLFVDVDNQDSVGGV